MVPLSADRTDTAGTRCLVRPILATHTPATAQVTATLLAKQLAHNAYYLLNIKTVSFHVSVSVNEDDFCKKQRLNTHTGCFFCAVHILRVSHGRCVKRTMLWSSGVTQDTWEFCVE